MKKLKITTIISSAILFISANTDAAQINFDDAWEELGQGWLASTYYSGLGVTLSGTYWGMVGGNGNGDPGHWDLHGTSGSAFLGANQGINASPTISWNSAVNNVSLDIGLKSGWTNTFLVSGFLGGSPVASFSPSISGSGANGTWETVSFASSIDSVTIQMPSGTGFAFGVDNVSWSVSDTGSTLALLGVGAAALAFARRRLG
jgi:hypothetical protein